MIRVEIVSKADCHLCEVAKEVLERVRKDLPFTLTVRDMESDPTLAERYRERIPVVFIENELAYQARVPEADFRRRLAALGNRG